MIELTIGQAQRFTAPAPFGLLGALKDDGTTNLMAVSWWTYLTNHPPMIGVCLSNKGLSGSLIKKNGEFTLNIIGESLKESGLKCGQCSGRDVNKADDFSIQMMDSANVKAKSVVESKVVFECKLSDSVIVGDHTLYIGEIAGIYGDADKKHLYAFNGYSQLNTLD